MTQIIPRNMISRTCALLMAVALGCMIGPANAQDENYSNLTLGLSGTPAEAFPSLRFFTRNGFEPQIHRFESVPGKGLMLDAYDSGGASLFVANDARAEAFSLGGNGVGIGLFHPDEALHIYSDDFSIDAAGNPIGFDQARLLIENDKADTEIRTMLDLVNNGGSRIIMENTGSGEAWAVMTNNVNNFVISRGGTGGAEFAIRNDGALSVGPGTQQNLFLAPNGNLHIAGSINQQSDRNMKEAFQKVDTDEILAKVNSLDITSWKYKDDLANIRHVGPMAQDFYSAFQLGPNNKSISSIDTAGVSLAAIQALSRQLEEKEDRIQQLEDQVAQLMSMMSERN